jgi:hypothetical protein
LHSKVGSRRRVGVSAKSKRSTVVDICPYGNDNFVCGRDCICQIGSDICYRFVRSPNVRIVEFDVKR